MSNSRDISGALVRPLNARSIALSALLGTHPPMLPARSLVALAELFGMAGGTMRTALSRMATNGEVEASDGAYRLAGPLLDRQRAQDVGRHSPATGWDGRWHSIVVAPAPRDLAERRRFRSSMANHRFGELRPDIWMRPANLPTPPEDRAWIVMTAEIGGTDPVALAERLWDLRGIARVGDTLLGELARLRAEEDWADTTSIPTIFTTSAAVVRFLRNEPMLPADLTPAGWPVERLRRRYDGVERDFQRLLRTFLRAA